jgi:predicted nucleic acid-binding protein
VSGLGWSGAPAAILDAVSDDRLVLVTSEPLLAELRRVLEYPRLAKVIRGGVQLADLVAASGIVVAPSLVLSVVRDNDDTVQGASSTRLSRRRRLTLPAARSERT